MINDDIIYVCIHLHKSSIVVQICSNHPNMYPNISRYTKRCRWYRATLIHFANVKLVVVGMKIAKLNTPPVAAPNAAPLRGMC